VEIEIKLDENFKEPKIIILTDKITDEINDLIKKLSETNTETIAGYAERGVELLDCNSIIRIYAENQKVYAQTEQGKYSIHARLYELEEKLDGKIFVRISNSEIVNLRKIKNMDLHMAFWLVR
jgi:DNA-binding LytR/AlgR family response regulator